jgi:23S rRNA pseudouridine1911/1915/1917 synthase
VSFQFDVTEPLAGKRLDAALAETEPKLSRAAARRLIEQGAVTVSGAQVKPAHRLRVGERVQGRVPDPKPDRLQPEPIPLEIVYEDSQLVVVDKRAGMVVHPAAGHREGTLVHALLHHCRELAGIGGVLRPGIVHRLDKGTSGLLVVAKTELAHRCLSEQFKAHATERRYLALVRGTPRADRGSIDAPIGRHPKDRKRFSTRVRLGRQAVTHWWVEERFENLTLIGVRPETGRTHQIRVHLASVGLSVAGDPVYGGGRKVTEELGLKRQALHAAYLGFDHPETNEHLSFDSELPEDLASVIARLRR